LKTSNAKGLVGSFSETTFGSGDVVVISLNLIIFYLDQSLNPEKVFALTSCLIPPTT
jgi:hypothetical protein